MKLISIVTLIVIASTVVLGQWGGGGFANNNNNNEEQPPAGVMGGASNQDPYGSGGGYGGEYGGMDDENSGEMGSESGDFDPMGENMGDPYGGQNTGNTNDQGDERIPTGFYKTARPDFVPPKDFKKRPTEPAQDDSAEQKPRRRASSGFNPSLNSDETPYGAMGAMEEDEDEDGGYDWEEREKRSRQNPEGPQHLDKCLKQVARYCSFRVMQENFAMFVDCVANVKERIREDCHEWAEQHRPCSTDVKNICMQMSPPETTECMLASKAKLSNECVDSTWFHSMEEGYDEFKSKMREAKQEGAPGYDGTDESDYHHDPSGVNSGYGSQNHNYEQPPPGDMGGEVPHMPEGGQPMGEGMHGGMEHDYGMHGEAPLHDTMLDMPEGGDEL